MQEQKNINYGKQARVGFKFYKELENIKDKRLRNGKSKERVSTEKITNMITKHESWEGIRDDIIKSTQEEFDKHGK